MNWRQVSVACALVISATCSPFTWAQSEDARSQIAALEREQSTLNQQIGAKQKQIDTLRSRPSPEQKELAEARRAIEEARTAYKIAPTPDNESKLKNAEFKSTLAERKYDKANTEVTALKDDVENLKQQIAAKQRQVKTLQQQIADQAAAPKTPAVDPKQQQKIAEERAKQKQQEQELERTRQQNDAAQKEIERLKALLATKESTNTSAPVKPAAAAAAVPVATAAAKPAPAAAAATTVDGLRRLTTTSEVVSALQALAQRAPNDGRRSKETNEVAYFKRQQNGKDAGKPSMASLKALGNGQYRGEVKLNPGSYEVVLSSTRWRADITDIGAATEFVVLLDNSDPAKPKVNYYNRSLEGK